MPAGNPTGYLKNGVDWVFNNKAKMAMYGVGGGLALNTAASVYNATTDPMGWGKEKLKDYLYFSDAGASPMYGAMRTLSPLPGAETSMGRELIQPAITTVAGIGLGIAASTAIGAYAGNRRATNGISKKFMTRWGAKQGAMFLPRMAGSAASVVGRGVSGVSSTVVGGVGGLLSKVAKSTGRSWDKVGIAPTLAGYGAMGLLYGGMSAVFDASLNIPVSEEAMARSQSGSAYSGQGGFGTRKNGVRTLGESTRNLVNNGLQNRRHG